MPNEQTLMEESFPFSQSLLWQLQRDYFQQQGIAAWQQGEVPHYVTCNPFMAKAYAEMIFAFMRDRHRLQPHSSERLYLLELGAGSGRLSYHLLTHLQTLCDNAAFNAPNFTYILSDLVQANIDFFKGHYKLRPFVTAGMLDYACFDATKDEEIALQACGIVLKKHSLEAPIFIIANYFFDSIPQDLFYIEEGCINQMYTSVRLPENVGTLSAGELLQQAEVTYTPAAVPVTGFYAGKEFNNVLAYYQQNLQRTWLLFPHAGICCLQNMQQLSTGGFVLLTADKGSHRLEELDYSNKPSIIKHGSFSLSVNYHAMQMYFQQQGAIACFTQHHYHSVNTSCVLAVSQPASYKELLNVYNKEVGHFGPDDFFSLKKHFECHIHEIKLWQLMSFIRLAGYDAHFFKQCIPALLKKVADAGEQKVADMHLLLNHVWDMYCPIGEEQDLAFDIGLLLYEMCRYSDALTFFNLSLFSYPASSSLYYNMAACCFQLKEDARAQEFIQLSLQLSPNNQQALVLEKELYEIYASAV